MMSAFILNLTGDLLLTVFDNPMFEVISILFLFSIGLSIFQLIKHTL